MKVFKINCGDMYYAFAASSEELAVAEFHDSPYSDFIDSIEEIPESEWNNKTITVYEDNDVNTEPFQISIREAICGTGTQLIYSNEPID